MDHYGRNGGAAHYDAGYAAAQYHHHHYSGGSHAPYDGAPAPLGGYAYGEADGARDAQGAYAAYGAPAHGDYHHYGAQEAQQDDRGNHAGDALPGALDRFSFADSVHLEHTSLNPVAPIVPPFDSPANDYANARAFQKPLAFRQRVPEDPEGFSLPGKFAASKLTNAVAAALEAAHATPPFSQGPLERGPTLAQRLFDRGPRPPHGTGRFATHRPWHRERTTIGYSRSAQVLLSAGGVRGELLARLRGKLEHFADVSKCILPIDLVNAERAAAAEALVSHTAEPVYPPAPTANAHVGAAEQTQQ
jgi:hypothetical protein